jgi:hypothetical protein
MLNIPVEGSLIDVAFGFFAVKNDLKNLVEYVRFNHVFDVVSASSGCSL